MDDNSGRVAEGVRVFGSAVLRVAPDLATVVVGVAFTDPEPSKAFKAARVLS